MNPLLRPAALLLTCLACLGSAPSPALAAGRVAPQRPTPPLAGAAAGEVIVKFRADASVLRRHALAARAQPAAVADVLAQRAGMLGARLGLPLRAGAAIGERTQVLRADGLDAAGLARRLAADPDVEFAEPNGRLRALAAPNDPLYPALTTRPRGPDAGQWYLRAPTATEVSGIDIESAWELTRGDPGIVVAVLDTGVRGTHPDLAGRLLPGHDFVSDPATANDGGGRDPDPTDPGDWITSAEDESGDFAGCGSSASSWHGTGTTALIAAVTDNGAGMAGAAPGVGVLPVRVLGKCGGTNSDIQAAMRWAAGFDVPGVARNPNPARVINLSLGGTGSCSSGYQDIVDELHAAGVLVVAAAGNSAGGVVGTPANCRGVVAVLALRHAGTKVGFSDLGPEITLAAPGGNCINVLDGQPCLYPVLTATNSGAQAAVTDTYSDAYDATFGTSFSSPLVAATAGLMLSLQPRFGVAETTRLLQDSARPFPTGGADNGSDPTPVVQCTAPTDIEQLQCYCTTAVCGAGMLDAGAAVAAAAGPVAAIVVQTATPTAGTALTLASGSIAASGRSIVGYRWELLDGGGTVTGFSSASNAASATLQPVAAGTLTVRLTVTDDLGGSAAATQAVVVAAAPVPPTPTPTPTPPATGGGGGGAFGPGWLAALAAATALIAPRRRRTRSG